jgi:putative tricarboxylic transport membrane protein
VKRSFAGPRATGAVLLAASVAIFVAVFSIRGREEWSVSGPRFVPLIVAIGLIVLSAAFLARTFVKPDLELAERSAEEDAATHWATPGLLLAAMVAYALVLEPVGYIISTAVFFVPVARLLGSRSPLRDVIVGLVLGVGLFTAFTQYLGVSLPGGLTPIF